MCPRSRANLLRSRPLAALAAAAAAAEQLLGDIMRVRVTLGYRVLATVPLRVVVGPDAARPD